MACNRKWTKINKASQSGSANTPADGRGQITNGWGEPAHGGPAQASTGWGAALDAWGEPIAGPSNTSDNGRGEPKTEAANTSTRSGEEVHAWGEPIARAAKASINDWSELPVPPLTGGVDAWGLPTIVPVDGWGQPVTGAADTSNNGWNQVEVTGSDVSNSGCPEASQTEWQNNPVQATWASSCWSSYDQSQESKRNERPDGCDCPEDTSPEAIEQAKNLKLIKTKRAQDDFRKKFDGWPYPDDHEKLLTLGPFLPNHYHRDPWSLPALQQSSTLFKILEISLLRGKILDIVMSNHFDAANLAVSCQSTWGLVAVQISFWDMTDGWYGRCQYPRFGPGSSDNGERQGSVQSVLVITPVRHPKRAPTHGSGHDRLYSRQLGNLKTMVRAIHNFSDFLYNVQFHRVPFLTIELLNLLIPGLRNLKVLGVYKCLLINISHTIKLLEIIKEDKPLEKENKVYLDFFPNYHQGPTCAGHEGWTGSYGVTWDNWGADTRLAIWAMVARIIPRALAQGINLVAPGTAFLRWLEMSPCWRVEETLKAIMAKDLDPEKRVALIDWPHYFGGIERMTAKYARRPEGWKWSVKSYRCHSCTDFLLGCFFSYSEVRAAMHAQELDIPEPPIRCLGCKLEVDLGIERDHYKREKQQIMRLWLIEDVLTDEDTEAVYNTTDVARALEAFDERNIGRTARTLDRVRRRDMTRGPEHLRWDRELDERQRHKTSAEKSRHGYRFMAPEVGAYDDWLVGTTLNEEEIKWWGFPHQRYCGFGNYIQS